MKRRVLEQSGDLGRERRVQIAIRFAEDDRDRDLECPSAPLSISASCSSNESNRPAVQARTAAMASGWPASPKNCGRIDWMARPSLCFPALARALSRLQRVRPVA